MAYINKEKFAEKIKRCQAFNRRGFEFEGNLLQGVVLDLIEAESTVDVEKVRHGEWVLHPDGSGTCNLCNRTQKFVWDFDNAQDYCGKCGAKMDGERRDT